MTISRNNDSNDMNASRISRRCLMSTGGDWLRLHSALADERWLAPR